LAPFFAYYSLVSFADSQIKTKKTKTPIFWRQNLLSSFLFIFSQFFSRQKKIPSKARKKRQQLKINRFRLFLNLKTTTKISRANYSYYNTIQKWKKEIQIQRAKILTFMKTKNKKIFLKSVAVQQTHNFHC